MGLSRSVFLIVSVTFFLGLCVSQECEDTSEKFQVGWSKMSCSEMIEKEKYRCYSPEYMEKCCKSCESAKGEIEGCEYGDVVPQWCTSSEQDVCPRDDLRDSCCEKCKKYIAAKGCEDKMNLVNIGNTDKMSCPEMAENVTDFCYKEFFNGLCCASCEKKKYDKEGCEYGDKDVKFCKTQKAHNCYYRNDTCCKTCAGFETGEPGCEYGDKEVKHCENITPHNCYFSNVTCCKTCAPFKTGEPGCEYGDKELKYCENLKASHCYQSKDICCKTCAAFETGEPDCEYGDKASWCRFVTEKQCEDRDDYRDACCATCKNAGSGKQADSGNENEEESAGTKNETSAVPPASKSSSSGAGEIPKEQTTPPSSGASESP